MISNRLSEIQFSEIQFSYNQPNQRLSSILSRFKVFALFLVKQWQILCRNTIFVVMLVVEREVLVVNDQDLRVELSSTFGEELELNRKEKSGSFLVDFPRTLLFFECQRLPFIESESNFAK